jgi:predicted DNA-binding transcriptional regulator AlpA
MDANTHGDNGISHMAVVSNDSQLRQQSLRVHAEGSQPLASDRRGPGRPDDLASDGESGRTGPRLAGEVACGHGDRDSAGLGPATTGAGRSGAGHPPLVETHAGVRHPLPGGLIDKSGIAALLLISYPGVNRMWRAAELPREVELRGRGPRWRYDEILAWIKARCPDRARWEAIAPKWTADARRATPKAIAAAAPRRPKP